MVSLLVGSLAAIAAILLSPRDSPRVAGLGHVSEPPNGNRALRRVYLYSVIKGGAYDQQELKTKLESDKVAARHYAAFDLEHVRTIKLDEARLAYVSYRQGVAIYWTRRPVLLFAGETLLTDGTLLARARCGNRISDTPQEPTAETGESEPSEEAMDAPQDGESSPPSPRNSELPAGSSVAEVEVKGSPQATEVFAVPPKTGSSPLPGVVAPIAPVAVLAGTSAGPSPPISSIPPAFPVSPPRVPVAVVPEPNAFSLLLTAAGVVFGARWWRRRCSRAERQ